jgi:hypothetical protein
MKYRKAIDINDLPIEVRKCIFEIGMKYLTKFFKIILKTTKMPNE